jgi:hypothetical protein
VLDLSRGSSAGAWGAHQALPVQQQERAVLSYKGQ